MTPHPSFGAAGAGLFCRSCGRRVSDGPTVEHREIRDASGRLRGSRPVAVVARCSCGNEQRVPLRGGKRGR